MSARLVTGFKCQPVSRYFIYTTIALPVIASLTATKYIYRFSYDPFIKEYHQFWRIFTHQLAYVNESEVLVAIVLLYEFRALERHFSPHRYLSLITVCFLYNMLFSSLIITLNFYTGSILINNVCTGPTTILFALLVHFREHIPVIYSFEIYGHGENKVVLSDQFLIYLLSFQLAITQGWQSLTAAFVGWILGAAIVRGILPGRSWRFPFWKRLDAYYNKPSAVDMIINETEREETPNSADEQDEAATETRPLTSQFLDTFRR